MKYNKVEIGPIIPFVFFILGIIAVCLVGISGVFAQIIDYRFMNTTVENNFSVSANSSLSANTYINVTADSTRKYLVVDLCSTVGSGFSTEVISNFDGSNTNFYKMYNLGESCTTKAGYVGATVRTYYLIKNWADSGNGNQAINNTTKFNNALSYSGIFELISVSLSDNVDTGDLSLNNQNIIINEIGSLNNSITNTEQNITNSITDTENNINQNIDNMESAIVDSNKETQEVIKDQFNSCRPSINLFNPEKVISDSNNNNTYITEDNNWIRYHTGIERLIYYPENIEENTQYTFKVIVKNGNNNNSIIFSAFYTDGTSSTLISKTFNANEELTLVGTTSQGKTLSFIRSGFTDGKTAFIKIDGTQLQEGSIATDYEPYGEEICTNKLDEAEETRKGIWATIKDLPNVFMDMLLGLFIPDDLSFIEEFKEVISNKLGFIASIPIQIIDFTLNLANVAFEEITSISFPSISIFGFNFWNAEEIDITIMLEKLKPFRYFTDLTCVILCCRTLYDMYHNFTGGGAN